MQRKQEYKVEGMGEVVWKKAGFWFPERGIEGVYGNSRVEAIECGWHGWEGGRRREKIKLEGMEFLPTLNGGHLASKS